MKKILFPLFLLFAMSSCLDTNESTLLVDLEIPPKIFGDGEIEFWLIGTNTSGEIIDQVKWNSESHLVLRSNISPGQKINVLMFIAKKLTSNNDQLLRIYTDVDPGRHWILGGKRENRESPDVVGRYAVTWKNVPDNIDTDYPFKTIQGMQGGYVIGETLECTDDDCTAHYAQTKASGKTLFVRSGSIETPCFFETDTLIAGKNYSIDFNSAFQPFENVIELNGETTSDYPEVQIAGVTGETLSWQVFDRGRYGQSPPLKYGYRSGYGNYLGIVTHRSGKKYYNWNVFAESLHTTDFMFPEEDFVINDETFSDFSFYILWNKHFSFYKSHWETDGIEEGRPFFAHIELIGNRANGNHAIREMPDEIIDNYPQFADLNSFGYSRATFTFTKSGPGYGIAIDALVNEDPDDPKLNTFFEIMKLK